jgi:hypothetical protein
MLAAPGNKQDQKSLQGNNLQIRLTGRETSFSGPGRAVFEGLTGPAEIAHAPSADSRQGVVGLVAVGFGVAGFLVDGFLAVAVGFAVAAGTVCKNVPGGVAKPAVALAAAIAAAPEGGTDALPGGAGAVPDAVADGVPVGDPAFGRFNWMPNWAAAAAASSGLTTSPDCGGAGGCAAGVGFGLLMTL